MKINMRITSTKIQFVTLMALWLRHTDTQDCSRERHGNRYRSNAAVISAETEKNSDNVAVIPR